MSVNVPTRTATPIVGYRCWAIGRRGFLWRRRALRASAWALFWNARQIEAKCAWADTDHRAPGPRCECGIHAVDSLASARWYRGREMKRDEVVIGAVQLWSAPGRKILLGRLKGRLGYQYRSPHARIVALAGSPAAAEIGAWLGVPVVPEEHLEAFAREYGGTQLQPPAAKDRRPRLPRLPLPSLPRPRIGALRDVTLGQVAGAVLRAGLWATVGLLRAVLLVLRLAAGVVVLHWRLLCWNLIGFAIIAAIEVMVAVPLLSHLETAVRHLP